MLPGPYLSDLPATLQSALAQRYALEAVIGRGGMATVYLATDLKHHRQVAIKVLRPDLAASLGAERFLKEIQIAARLNHPYILGLHDSGESAGFLYYVMPYVDGGSLRQQLERERRLDLGPALAIAGSVADALAYAHRMGVFHRDIKPENILFSQGHPIVADFGIAKAISTAGGANLTRTGFPVGTPGYMSPEQAAGLTDLDERTDVYSLAVVVYEMLVGEVPRGWPSEDAVREARFLEAPASHRSRLAPLGPAVESALVRAMAIRHEQRTGGPGALLAQLRGAPPPALPTTPARRVYSEAEVAKIVARAAELEAQVNTVDGSMTIGGVEQLAAEVGITPELVRQAAGTIRPRVTSDGMAGANKPSWWLGAPTKLLIDRVVEGEVPDIEFPLLIDEVRTWLGSTGIVSTLGRSVSYVMSRTPGTGVGRDLQVSISVRAGKTRITIMESLAGLAGGIVGGFGGGFGGAGMGAVIAFSVGTLAYPWAILALGPIWLSTVFAATRSWYYYTARKRRGELEELADRLAELARDVVPRTPRFKPSPPPAGRLPA